MKKCKYANKYQAKFPPKCGPCDVCREKWSKTQQERDKIPNLLKNREFNIKIF